MHEDTSEKLHIVYSRSIIWAVQGGFLKFLAYVSHYMNETPSFQCIHFDRIKLFAIGHPIVGEQAEDGSLLYHTPIVTLKVHDKALSVVDKHQVVSLRVVCKDMVVGRKTRTEQTFPAESEVRVKYSLGENTNIRISAFEGGRLVHEINLFPENKLHRTLFGFRI